MWRTCKSSYAPTGAVKKIVLSQPIQGKDGIWRKPNGIGSL